MFPTASSVERPCSSFLSGQDEQFQVRRGQSTRQPAVWTQAGAIESSSANISHESNPGPPARGHQATTSLSSKPVRKRATHTRTKNGCRVCRIRHVRCDLTKPACHRCTSTGRKCEGYPPDSVPDTATPARSSALGPALRARVSLDDDEQSNLTFFQHRTASRLGGYLEDHFWNRLILQLGTSEEPILAIIIALGALHRHLEERTFDSQAENRTLARSPASQLYGKAVRLLNDHINSEGWQKLEVTLVCCILCTGFEWLRGNAEAATLHIEAGISILHSWQSRKVGGPSCWSPAGHLIRDKLAPFYTRLALQSYTVANRSISWSNIDTTATSIEPFESIQHARDSLCNLLAEVYLVPETNRLLRQRTPQSQREHARFEASLSRWASHFVDFTSNTNPCAGSLGYPRDQTQATITILWLIHTCATLLLAQIMPQLPSDMPDTRPGFQRVLYLADTLLSRSYTSRLSIDLGLVAPLAFVVQYCPLPDLKQRALALLAQHDIHEGSWSSQATVRRDAQLARPASEGARLVDV